jgi:hypothetical protein
MPGKDYHFSSLTGSHILQKLLLMRFHRQRFILITLIICSARWTFAQSDTAARVKYTSEFHFKDGVYINFDEWKNNRPRIRDFSETKANTFGAQDEIELHYSCKDIAGSAKNCIVRNCFGFVHDGNFYISQGFYGYYFRVFLIGSLTHFLAFTGFNDKDAYISSEPNGFIGSANDYREYLLDFDSGRAFEFTYKNFSAFLKEHDAEMRQQLINTKKKKQMIHHYLLKYNETHPIYLPAD